MSAVEPTPLIKPADPFIQEMCDKVKPQAEKMVGRNFSVFEAKSYTTQDEGIVIFFFTKVFIGDDKYVHLRVSQNRPGIRYVSGYILDAVIFGKTLDDPIIYFK